MKKFIAIAFLCWQSTTWAQGFLHRENQKIVDGKGNNVVLRGLGLGGWMVQEGYMLKTGHFAGPQHQIKAKIQEVIGQEATEKFYQAYRDNNITKRDIDSLTAWGFNSVRLPMHYNLYTPAIEKEKNNEITWLEEGFKRTDKLLQWCEENKIYLILDLHAAPGGQGKDAAISDYDSTKPSLWENENNRKKTIQLWSKLAERYKDHPWIGGYDLINEPNWNFTGTNANGCDEASNKPLRDLQIEITQAIRKVDQNHLIFIEGNCWGNNYNGMFPLWDDNLALSFHKYWNANNQEEIQKMLEYRTQYNVPIWLGESGENSNVWFKDAIALMEKNNIGWAFWPMKKIESIAGVTSVTMPEGYEKLVQFWQKGGQKPSATWATNILMELAENYKMEKVKIKPDVIDAMFRQVEHNTAIPFKNHQIPSRIEAVHYDLGTQGVAYFDTDIQNLEGTKFTPYNKEYAYRNDGVDIGKNKKTNQYYVGHIDQGEWLQYTVNAKNNGNYTLSLSYIPTANPAKVHVIVNDKKHKTIVLKTAKDKSKSYTQKIATIALQKGLNPIKIVFENGGIECYHLDVKAIK